VHLLKVLDAQKRPTRNLVLLRYAVGSESTEQRERGFEDRINQAIAEQKPTEPHIKWLSTNKYAGATVDSALKMDFIKWRGLRVADIRYASSPASLRIGSITAIEPYVRMVIAPDRTVNITRILTPPGAARSTPQAAGPGAQGAGAAAAEPAPVKPLTPFPTSIGVVRFVNASANYADLWIKPSFAVGIQTLSGTVTGLSSGPRSRAQIALDGKVDRYSPVHIGGAVNLLSAALYTDVTLSFKDLDLTIVNPYSGYFAGYLINKGKLSVDVSYKIDQRQLDARQHFVVDQLELGDRVDSPGAAHLPLKIAVALLKDRNGVIDLELPDTPVVVNGVTSAVPTPVNGVLINIS